MLYVGIPGKVHALFISRLFDKGHRECHLEKLLLKLNAAIMTNVTAETDHRNIY